MTNADRPQTAAEPGASTSGASKPDPSKTGPSKTKTELSKKDQALLAAVRDLVAPLADARDLEVLEVQVKGGKGRRIVKVVADSADIDAGAGVDIDTIARLSRDLGTALDELDLIPGAYDLEVTSPGADRPLRRARDFARNVGRDVRVHLAEGRDGPTERTGALVATSETDITLDIDGTEHTVPLADVDHGVVVLPW